MIQGVGHATVNLDDIQLGSQGSGWGTLSPPVSRLNPVLGTWSHWIQFGGETNIDQAQLAFGIVTNWVKLYFHARSPGVRDSNDHLSNSLTWLSFTRGVLKDSRPMTDWERKAAADFFWSEFD
jgi:hypothetical protein